MITFYAKRAYANADEQAVVWGDGSVCALGHEPTPDLFVAHLIECFASVWRVLRDDGVLIVELADSYASSDISASRSRRVQHEPPYGIAGKEQQGSQGIDRAYPHSDGEHQADSPSHPSHTSHNGPYQQPVGELDVSTNHDSEHLDSETASLGDVAHDAQVSTRPIPLPEHQGENLHSATSVSVPSACRLPPASVLLSTDGADVPSYVGPEPGETPRPESRSRYSTDGTSSIGGALADHKGGTASDSLSYQYHTPAYHHSQIPAQTRIGIPERFVLAMAAAGWRWRDALIWRHTSAMPESVRGWSWQRCRVKVGKWQRGHPQEDTNWSQHGDAISERMNPEYADCPGCPRCLETGGYVLRKGQWRTTVAHSYVYVFSKTNRYFGDGEAVRQEWTGEYLSTGVKNPRFGRPGGQMPFQLRGDTNPKDDVYGGRTTGGGKDYAAAGANLRSVLDIGPEPFTLELCAACRHVYDRRHYARLPKRDGKRVCTCGSTEWVSHYACVDEATECLTKRGWKRWNELQIGEDIASYDLAAKILKWVPLKDVATYQVENQEMVAIEGRSLSCVLTPNHRCVVQDTQQRIGIIEASDLHPHLSILTAAPMTEGSPSFLPDWAELLGWYITEGWRHKDRPQVSICQSSTANPEKVDRIRTLLQTLNIGFREYAQTRMWRGREANMAEFRLDLPSSSNMLEMEGALHRVLGWSVDARRRFLDAFIAGDGHVRKSDGRRSIIQKDKGVADLVQAVATTLGFSTTASQRRDGEWTVYLSQFTARHCHDSKGSIIKPQRYTGLVWCPQTKYTTWVARRNGRVFITGNTFPTKLPEIFIKAFTSEAGCCPKCGVPFARVIERGKLVPDSPEYKARGDNHPEFGVKTAMTPAGESQGHPNFHYEQKTLGWRPTCRCDAGDAVPCTVLDCFCGSGSTLVAAKRNGRDGVGVDVAQDYLDLAAARLAETQAALA